MRTLASMCLVDDDLVGSKLCPGTPTSYLQDRMTTNSLSLYASFLGLQAQHAETGYNEVLISALRETQCDQLMEDEASPSPVELTQPFAVGPNNETPAPKTSLPSRRKTRSESSMAGYVRPSILEPPLSDDSEPEGSLTGSAVAKDRAASSLATKDLLARGVAKVC